MHHAFFIEAEAEAGTALALESIERELGMKAAGNPDVVVLKYGLLSVEDTRRIIEIASTKAFGKAKTSSEGRSPDASGEASRAIVIAASRAYHEAQNALLKIFEEPAPGTHLFLILPSAGMLLPTLKSRMQIVDTPCPKSDLGHAVSNLPEAAQKFLAATSEKRTAIAKKLATGDDEDDRRANRDEALAIVNGIELAAYRASKKQPDPALFALLSDLAILRTYLHERSAPVRMILEHVALVIPKSLK